MSISISRYLKKTDWEIEANSKEHERLIEALQQEPPPWFNELNEREQKQMIKTLKEQASAGTALLDSRLLDELKRGTLSQGLREGLLDEIWPLLGSGLKQREDNKQNASKPRRKIWADALADELIKNHKGFPQAWRAIPRGEGQEGKRYAGYEVYRNGEILKAHGKAVDDEIKKESFRTGYFAPAKNRQK